MTNIFSISDEMETPSMCTPWTFIHILSGILMYMYVKYMFHGISDIYAFIIVFSIHTVYEMKDLRRYYYTNSVPPDTYDNNSAINSVYDTFAVVIGIYIAMYITKSSPVSKEELVRYTLYELVTVSVFLMWRLG